MSILVTMISTKPLFRVLFVSVTVKNNATTLLLIRRLTYFPEVECFLNLVASL